MQAIAAPFLRVLGLSIALLLVMASPAIAGVVTFNDLTDSLTFSTDIPSRASGSCDSVNETCTVTISAPGGGVFSFTSSIPTGFVEQGTQIVSDEVCGGPAGPCQFLPFLATVTFASDIEGSSLGTCSGCPAETGAIQPAFSITWGQGEGLTVVDTIQFQSDVEIPEPASVLLTLVGTAMLCGALKIRRNVS